MAKIVVCRSCRQERDHVANGHCAACDQHRRRYGWDRPPHLDDAWDAWNDPLLRFMRLVKHEGHCWEWIGSAYNGYGRFQVDGETVLATRWVYERLVAPIPDGLQLDHLCRNPPCVFPGHLEPVTPAENSRRGSRARQTHCGQGHPLSGDNLRVWTDKKSGHSHRVCRECQRAGRRRFKAKWAARDPLAYMDRISR